MAHEVETMAWGVTPPWHGLGVQVDLEINTDDMLVKAGLNWEVKKEPTFTLRDGVYQPIPDHFALVRQTDGSVLSTVGKTYKPIQNAEALDFFREFVEAGQMNIDTAGSLQNGKRIWALASLKEGFTLAGGDEVQGYLLFTNPHMNGFSQTTMFTPIRVVCANTLAMALNSASQGLVRHAHFSKFDPETVKQALGLVKNQLDGFRTTAEFLASRRYDLASLQEYMVRVFAPAQLKAANDIQELARLPNVAKALDAVTIQPGGELASSEGTWWGALNAVTYLADHKLGRNPDSRLGSSWYGEGQKFKLRAANLAVDFAQKAA